MTIGEQLTSTQAALDAFASTADSGGGHCIICSDLTHLWGCLLQGPTKLRILIMYNGEVPRENWDGGSITGRVDRRFLIVVSRGRGLNLNRGDGLVIPTQKGSPLFDLVEQVRDICRGMMFDPLWCERPVEYKGILPFPTEGTGVIVDAYQVEISVGTQLGMIETAAQQQQDVVFS